jgi:hypothetical protein
MNASTAGYAPLQIHRKNGNEPFCFRGESLNASVLDFWRWSASDLVSNSTRGKVAEYLVACALGIADGTRAEWDAFDLVTPSGLTIEVKSSAYLQTWFHQSLSDIQFGIRRTRAWNSSTNKFASELKRQADIYVFCLLHHKEKQTLDPLNVDQWEFYVLPVGILNEYFPTRQTISLANLLKVHPLGVHYNDLATGISKVAEAASQSDVKADKR